MKISKKENVSACTDIPTCDPKADAIRCIEAAIRSLASIAKTDPVANDSIANLAVVLFDLK